jgi:hypothetical protein
MRLLSGFMLAVFVASLLGAVGCGDNYQTPPNNKQSTQGVPPPSKQPQNQKKTANVDAP